MNQEISVKPELCQSYYSHKVYPKIIKEVEDEVKEEFEFKQEPTQIEDYDVVIKQKEESMQIQYIKLNVKDEIRISEEPIGFTRHTSTHTGEKPYQCNQCDNFFSRNYLVRHMSTHIGEKSYQCSQCDKAFSRNDNLKQHMRTHRENQYQCTQCEKVFSSKSNCAQHMNTHTGEKPYQCSQCDKAFSH